ADRRRERSTLWLKDFLCLAFSHYCSLPCSCHGRDTPMHSQPTPLPLPARPPQQLPSNSNCPRVTKKRLPNSCSKPSKNSGRLRSKPKTASTNKIRKFRFSNRSSPEPIWF